MPKLFGLNIVAVLVASIVFYVIGFIWYAFIFEQTWMAAAGIAQADIEGESPLWMLGGLVITVMQVVGLGLVMKWKQTAAPVAAAKTAATLWLVFALPFVLYTYFYMPSHSLTLLAIDAGHFLIGWVVSAALLSLLKT